MSQSRVAVIVALLALLASACAGVSEETQAFCDAFVAGEAMFNTDQPDPAEIESQLVEIETNAPEDIAGAAGAVVASARTVLQTGDFSVMESEEFASAESAVDSFMADECGYPILTVAAQDPTNGSGNTYQFADVPDSLPAGITTIEFVNEGGEAHEVAVLRIDDGETMGIEEILALPEEEAMEHATFVGNAFAMPGEEDNTGTGFVDLTPGEYAFICFVPVGATPENIPALEAGEIEGGPPHFTQGMVAEFTVTG